MRACTFTFLLLVLRFDVCAHGVHDVNDVYDVNGFYDVHEPFMVNST